MNNYSDGSYLITKFFPICDGVYLHKELPELLPYPIGSINSYSSLLYYKTGSTGIRIDFESCDNRIVKKISFSSSASMPAEWEHMGLTWEISYKDLWLLTTRKGLVNIVMDAPHMDYVGGRGFLAAEFAATPPDGSFSLIFNFMLREGKTIFDKNTLYSIKAF